MEESTSDKDNVKVVLRVRPMNERERSTGSKQCCVVEDNNKVILDAKPENKTFSYDFVADNRISQEDVFRNIGEPILDSCLEGYNGTIFAYGQTGSGKTYTIQGPGFDDVCLTEQDEADRGILPRSFEYLFNKLENMSHNDTEECKVEYLIRASYLEIYNEQIMDLMDPTSQNLQIREDIKKGVYVEGLIEEVSSSAHEMLEIIKKGALRRHTGSTNMNKESSRSHSVLSTTIESKIMKNGLFNVKISKFNLIDLAGSERAKSTDAGGSRLKEAGMINKSLSALGNVINSLVEVGQGKSRHVHYRDSKLTFLLRDSLGGNSKTLMIANISPASDSFGETLSTLKFAQRAKLIKNKAIINEDSSGTVAILKDEIKRLKLEITKIKVKKSNNTFTCPNCSNLGPQVVEDDLTQFNEDSLLADLDDDDISEEKAASPEKADKREETKEGISVAKLESLLKGNLNQLTQMQDFYDKEVSDKDVLVQRYKKAVDNYEKQNARDNMIIKFRDSAINRFGKLKDKIGDEKLAEQFTEFEQEIKLLKDQMKENPKLAAAHAEVEELKIENEKLKKESGSSAQSYCSLYKSNLEFLNELKDYIDLNEEERQKRVKSETIEYTQQIEELTTKLQEAESQTEGYRELMSTTQVENDSKTESLEKELAKVGEELTKMKDEIEVQKEKEIIELKERLIQEEREKNEINAKHQDLFLQKMKSESERDNLLSEKNLLSEEKHSLVEEKHSLVEEKHSLEEEKNSIANEKMNIQNLFEQMKEQYTQKENEFLSQISKLVKETEDFKNKVTNMQNSLDLNKEKIEFLETVKIEKERLAKETSQQKEEIDTLNADVRKYEKDNMAKADEISDLSNQLGDARNAVARLEEDLDTAESQHKYSISELQTKVDQITTEHEETKTELKKTRQQLGSEQERTENLKKQFEDESNKKTNTVDILMDEKRDVESKNSELSDQIQTLNDQVAQLNEKVGDLTHENEENCIQIQLKTTQAEECEKEVEDLIKSRDEFQNQYISLLNKNENNEREASDSGKKLRELKRENEGQQTQIQTLENEIHQKTIEISNHKEVIDKLKNDKAKERVKNINLAKELSSLKMDSESLKKNLNEEKNLRELALKEKSDKENELKKPRQISTDEFLKHPGTKKLCNAVKSLVHDIEEQSSNANNVTTQNKIKYLQKIKEENNFLKKELVSLFKENRRLSEAKGDDESQSKNVKLLESQLRKMSQKCEVKHKEMKLTIKNVNKMCDYILSRPQIPSKMKEVSNDNLKIKQAIQAVGYMSKYIVENNKIITEKEKEILEVKNKEGKLEELLKASNEEKNYLRGKVDSLIMVNK